MSDQVVDNLTVMLRAAGVDEDEIDRARIDGIPHSSRSSPIAHSSPGKNG